MINEHHSLTAAPKKVSKIRKAAQLYDVAAAFRYQIVAGLDDKKNLGKYYA